MLLLQAEHADMCQSPSHSTLDINVTLPNPSCWMHLVLAKNAASNLEFIHLASRAAGTSTKSTSQTPEVGEVGVPTMLCDTCYSLRCLWCTPWHQASTLCCTWGTTVWHTSLVWFPRSLPPTLQNNNHLSIDSHEGRRCPSSRCSTASAPSLSHSLTT